ncbi:MAG TPA: GNAT family N-acetyltransferase [Candidatus Dormibacteraeota bacterium]|nr:GNAT family N-acetyltransferase [Candidatus Dormibacteraeota bacterium]
MIEIESWRDGRPGLASLEPSDGELLGRLFSRLSPESVYRRFFSPIPNPDYFIKLLLRVDRYDREAIVAVEGGEIVGVAQYSRLPGACQADLAIVVADGWQRQGLATRLITVLAERAVAHGINTFAVAIQSDNFGAQRLFTRIAPGARLAFSGGVGEGVIQLATENGHE